MNAQTTTSIDNLRNIEPEAMASMPTISDNSKIAKALSSNAFGIFDPDLFDHLWRIGKAFASTKLVPVHFQGKQEDCFIAAALALELKANPLIVMQNIYVVHGTPGFSTKFAIALANERGPFKDIIQFKEFGQKGSPDYGIVAFAHTQKGSYCEFKADMKMAKAEGWDKNPKYKSMPDVMLAYRAASFLIRRHCPEVLFGMQTQDEVEFQAQTESFIDGEVLIERPGENYQEEIKQPEKEPQPVEPENSGMGINEMKNIIHSSNGDSEDDLLRCLDLLRSTPGPFKEAVKQEIIIVFGKDKVDSMLGTGESQPGLNLE